MNILYVIDKQIYFSETTFFPCGSFMLCTYEDDIKTGKMLNLY